MCFHICIYICNPEGVGSQKMTRCVLHFHHLVFFLNTCHTLQWHTSISILTTKKTTTTTLRVRKENKEHVFYVN